MIFKLLLVLMVELFKLCEGGGDEPETIKSDASNDIHRIAVHLMSSFSFL